MNPLFDWATRHGITQAQLHDLQVNVLGCSLGEEIHHSQCSERGLQQAVRIKSSQQGRRMFRNNVGVSFRPDGVPVRFGLGNDSPKMHSKLRSSDLIGITPILVTPQHVGMIFGLFTSWEIKKPGWKFNPNDEHSVCQSNWNKLIVSLGGDGRFITSENQI